MAQVRNRRKLRPELIKLPGFFVAGEPPVTDPSLAGSPVTESAAPAQPPCKSVSQPCVDKAVLAAVILDWRLQGHTLTRIARELPPAGYAPLSALQINRIVQSELKRAAKLPGNSRSIELMRLDQLQAAHYAKALAGEAAATDRVLAIMDRRAKLLGLHAPRASEDAPDTADAKQKLLEKLDAMAARISGAGAAPTPPSNGLSDPAPVTAAPAE